MFEMVNSFLSFYNEKVEKIIEILNKYLQHKELCGITDTDISAFAWDIYNDYVKYDLERYLTDPAIEIVTGDDEKYRTEQKMKYAYCYNGLNAIIYYRIAHKILTDWVWYKDSDSQDDFEDEEWQTIESENAKKQFFIEMSKKISEQAAKETGVEINPSATIGKGFVIDHSMGVKIGSEKNVEKEESFSRLETTVIGETCVIGDNCTILNDVILGAKNLKNNIPGKRHPQIGNNVIIAAGVRIFGNVHIGDNVFISPYCVVTSNIPSDTKVLIVNQLQLESCKTKSNKQKVKIYGIVPDENNSLVLYGKNLDEKEIKIVNDKYEVMDSYIINITLHQNDMIRFSVKLLDKCVSKNISLMIGDEKEVVFYINSDVLNNYINEMEKFICHKV